MIFTPPFKDKTLEDLYKAYQSAGHGYYPVGISNYWHGGIHIPGETPVVAIANGKIIVYRLTTEPLATEFATPQKYSNSFVLIKHEYTSPKGNNLVFYSLYYHLLPYALWSEDQKKQTPLFLQTRTAKLNKNTNLRDIQTGEEIVLLEKNTVITFETIDSEWAKIVTPTAADGRQGKIKYQGRIEYEFSVSNDKLNTIITAEQEIKASDIIGFPGLYQTDTVPESQRFIHFEIFADSSVVNFITNPFDEGQKNLLKIPAGSLLKKKGKKYSDRGSVPLVSEPPKKTWTLSLSKSVDGISKATVLFRNRASVPRKWLSTFSASDKTYRIDSAHLNDLNALFGNRLTASSKLAFRGYSDENGIEKKESDKTDYRLVSRILTDAEKATLWIDTSENGIEDKAGEVILTKDITNAWSESPNTIAFTEAVTDGSTSEEIIIEEKKCSAMQAPDGMWWFEVSAPYQSPTSIADYIERFLHAIDFLNPQKTISDVMTSAVRGWISQDSISKIALANWPHFTIEEETGAQNSDGFCDWRQLTPFFKNIFDRIDADNNNVVNSNELKNAMLKNEVVDLLNLIICKHSSEWYYSDEKWNRLNTLIPDISKRNQLKEQIKKFCWWSDVAARVSGFPSDATVWHFMPLKFVEMMGRILGINLTVEVLKKIATSASDTTLQKYIDGLNITLRDCKIQTPLQIAHFLAQIIHESGSFHYTAEAGVADNAYGGYKGRGFIQITGESNYKNYGLFAGIDCTSTLENKQLLEKDPHVSKSAGWFWSNLSSLNAHADNNDFLYITAVINGAYNGYDDRLKWLKNGLKMLCPTSDIATEYAFADSNVYNNKKYSFAWGLWHDDSPGEGRLKKGCTKDKSKALEGYRRFIQLHDSEGKPDIVKSWYGIPKTEIRNFAEKRINELT